MRFKGKKGQDELLFLFITFILIITFVIYGTIVTQIAEGKGEEQIIEFNANQFVLSLANYPSLDKNFETIAQKIAFEMANNNKDSKKDEIEKEIRAFMIIAEQKCWKVQIEGKTTDIEFKEGECVQKNIIYTIIPSYELKPIELRVMLE